MLLDYIKYIYEYDLMNIIQFTNYSNLLKCFKASLAC
jgi:hypothetical protein